MKTSWLSSSKKTLNSTKQEHLSLLFPSTKKGSNSLSQNKQPRQMMRIVPKTNLTFCKKRGKKSQQPWKRRKKNWMRWPIKSTKFGSKSRKYAPKKTSLRQMWTWRCTNSSLRTVRKSWLLTWPSNSHLRRRTTALGSPTGRSEDAEMPEIYRCMVFCSSTESRWRSQRKRR